MRQYRPYKSRRDQNVGTPAEWLERAAGAYDLAINLPPNTIYETHCPMARFSAEVALKAVCRHHGIIFPPTEDFDILLNLLTQTGVHLPAEVRAAKKLGDYADHKIEPGARVWITEQEWAEAVTIAKTVLKWATLETGAGRAI